MTRPELSLRQPDHYPEGVTVARPVPSAQQAGAKWNTGFSGASQAWIDGVNSVQTAPGLAAAAAADRMLANFQAALPKYKANVAAVTTGDWQAACKNKGMTRFASGAQAGQAKYVAKMSQVLPAISQIRDSLPPRGDVNANLERSRQMGLQLHTRAQQGW